MKGGGRPKAIDMNQIEPPQTVNVSTNKPVKRLFVLLAILCVILILAGKLGLDVWRTTQRMLQLEKQRYDEQQLRQQLKTNQEVEEK